MKNTFLILLVFLININASEVKVVPVSNQSISYKEKIFASKARLLQTTNKFFNKKYISKNRPVCKEYVDMKAFKNNEYRAKHYIFRNKPICKKDVYIPISKKIKFNFGLLEIEKDGEIIKETDKYIKIKNLNGTIEKIYKNGHKR